MAEVLTLPRLGETMERGRVVAWQKLPGQSFRRGETIVEVESDKTVVELPALFNGTLVEILAIEGDDIIVGAPLCRYEREQVGLSQVAPADVADRVSTVGAVDTAAVDTTAGPAAQLAAGVQFAKSSSNGSAARYEPTATPLGELPPARGAVRRATPAARSLARKHNIDLHTVRGTGRRARIDKADIVALIAEPPAVAKTVPVDPALRFVDVDAGRVVYREWRARDVDGSTVMLLHGFGGESAAWSNIATLIARHGCNVVAPDLPAHGATAISAATIADIADAIVAFVLLRGEKVELVGQSLGGGVAVAVALAVPQFIRRLTLIAPVGLGTEIDGDFIEGMSAVTAPGALAHLLRRVALRPAPLSRDQLEHMARTLGGAARLGALAAALAVNGRQQLDIVADLDRLIVPTRVIWGLDDRIIPWTQVAQLPANIPAHLVAGAGHMPHWDQPAKVAALFTPIGA